MCASAMKIQVAYYGMLKIALGKPKEEIELDGATDVRALIDKLVEKYGADIREQLLDSNDEIKRNVKVMVGDEEIGHLQGMETPLGGAQGTSIVVLLPAMRGG